MSVDDLKKAQADLARHKQAEAVQRGGLLSTFLTRK